MTLKKQVKSELLQGLQCFTYQAYISLLWVVSVCGWVQWRPAV